MKTAARLVLEDVIEGGGKSKWDANAIEKCVQGKDGLKGEDAKAKFQTMLRSIDKLFQGEKRLAEEQRLAEEREDELRAETQRIQDEKTKTQVAVTAALLEKKNAQEAREAKRRKEQEEEEALERILGTPQICIEELMDTMMCYPWTSRTRLAPNWVRIPSQVLVFVLTSQVFGTPEEGANIRQGYCFEHRTVAEVYALLAILERTLQKCGQELDEAIVEDEPCLRVYELVSAQLDKHYALSALLGLAGQIYVS